MKVFTKGLSFKEILFVCLYVLIISGVFNSCKKEDNSDAKSQQASNIPATIFGTYNMNVINNTTSGNSIQTWEIIPNNSTSVLIIPSSQTLGDTIVMNVNNNSLEIPSQTFPNGGWVGGNKTVSGSGNYSDPQIVLTIGQFFSAANTSYNYSATGVRQ
jgi:hypothetical protein